MLRSPRYALPCDPMREITFPAVSSGWLAASRFSSYSTTILSGKRASPVWIWLLRMKSAYSKPERKCALPDASVKVALVNPFDAKAQGGARGKPNPPAQPGPSPGTCMPPLPVVDCRAKAEADNSASGKRQSISVNDGLEVHGPALNVAETEAPRPNESSPLEF